MSTDINILVNGNRCKQYHHQGKRYIEAKHGSEYVIEVKNNTYKRNLVVSAVDGLNVLTGKTASESDSGYVVDGYNSQKIKGFRFSDDEWAMFRFGYKVNGNTYAQSKEDGSEKNIGVIGIRIFDEYVEPPVVTTTSTTTTWFGQPYYNTNDDTLCYNPGMMGDSTSTVNYNYYGDVSNTSLGGNSMSPSNLNTSQNQSNKVYTRGLSSGHKGSNPEKYSVHFLRSLPAPRGFDIGTEWGRKEKSKVTTVTFNRGELISSLDIYYASRESLLEMGVPITNEIKVNLPQSFPSPYATPPKNWSGQSS